MTPSVITPGLVAFRYDSHRTSHSPGDPLLDAVNQVGFLTSRDYAVELLISRHGSTHASAVARSRSILAHVRASLDYVDQAMKGPASVAFLPTYYAVLNLMKLYILLSPRHGELKKNRWHGAQYQVFAKDSRSLLTDEIVVKRGGTIPLFYETIAGTKLRADTRIAMKDVYPYIADCASEWEIATGSAARLAGVRFTVHSSGVDRRLEAEISLPRGSRSATHRSLPALRGLRQDAQNPRIFRPSRTYALTSTPQNIVNDAVNRVLVYSPVSPGWTVTPVTTGRLLMFEELPIALAMFHMSSVVRYKPEFLHRLRDSRHWPVVSAAGRLCLYRFLTLFWSYAQQETVTFSRE
jgi:hypothetical protein